MLTLDKMEFSQTDISLGALLTALDERPEMPLVFHYAGRPIRAGYHITEVKAGQFSALDCGANPEAWSEIFVQLWDIDEDQRTHMRASKFTAIIRKVSEHVGLDSSAKLTFEVSDGVQPMQLFSADFPYVEGQAIRVDLGPRPASCKPRDRWLAEQQAPVAACCGPSTKSSCCA
ncbi:hypothetical protein JJB09_10080 [Rhizobium sp. KVB221]|uniref:Uncharacterized protein n=1 Tax=Rhizobium setariae TaxID=2801340 RepID=A0A936YPC1_9HYPH|nr:DUF6428 family protein [Rhizobium setariae]MBL0372377.1 hypothetical protein [Rhizobium setariae]